MNKISYHSEERLLWNTRGYPYFAAQRRTMKFWTTLIIVVFFFTRIASAQQSSYPQQYFRHPLNIPMQLVANFGEIRTNHWHMGLDIRTQQKVNLPVYAAAAGYVSRVSIEPGGFGQAIYIDHPNGYTTVYAHLNAFFPALAFYVKQRQYEAQSWKINIVLPPGLFPLQKGDFIAYSGSTGASEGPHVHFEIRDTKTENCLNPLLFGFPIPDGVPPTINRLAVYDRSQSTYSNPPRLLPLKRSGGAYAAGTVRVSSRRISFAVGATDRFTATPNPNGIYSAQTFIDGREVSAFFLDDISYNDTRYINAQLDFPYKSRGGGALQHITPLPGANTVAYDLKGSDGVITLNDEQPHEVQIRVRDAAQNLSTITLTVQYDPSMEKRIIGWGPQVFYPNEVNIFEGDGFEVFTTEKTIYDTVNIAFAAKPATAGSASSAFGFLSSAIPAHDSFTVRIRATDIASADQQHVVILNTWGSRKYLSRAIAQRGGWYAAKFRQFGSFQAFVDTVPPHINNPPLNLASVSRIVFTPTDNFDVIRNFRAEVDGQWLRFSNDKGKSWIYAFDEKFPKGAHVLKVTVEDEAGNITVKEWNVNR